MNYEQRFEGLTISSNINRLIRKYFIHSEQNLILHLHLIFVFAEIRELCHCYCERLIFLYWP